MGNACSQPSDDQDIEVDHKRKSPKGKGKYGPSSGGVIKYHGGIFSHVKGEVEQTRQKHGDYDFSGNDFEPEDYDVIEIAKNHYYQGEYDDTRQKPIGCGIEVFPDGSLYEGENGGPGRLIKANGDMYEGEFDNNKADGEGTYITKDGQKYVGSWSKDKKQGKGVETWPDGARYEGDYKEGNWHGKGEYTLADNSNYKGYFKNGEICGKGKYKWADGDTYNGEWKDSKMHGKGVFKWKDGKTYEGDFQRGI
ncbi:unnamed protein product [Moneuplotes crassus]|uniref:Uncharacterized protein n=1 Tax=Euplotes crassus TaxID=5936 RepID=A0AAD1XHH2_EUPCR|nr:unnamed protein product [Moneuplotes crassus]